MSIKKIAFGGGCFWCTEGVLQRIEGVTDSVIGYGGGNYSEPTYLSVTDNPDGHAEIVVISYDDGEVNLEYLLQVFFLMHNPTKSWIINNKKGPLYRSVILFTEEEQCIEAKKFIKALQQEFNSPILTEILPLKNFKATDSKYQNYYAENPENPFCKNVILPKIIKVEEKLNPTAFKKDNQ